MAVIDAIDELRALSLGPVVGLPGLRLELDADRGRGGQHLGVGSLGLRHSAAVVHRFIARQRLRCVGVGRDQRGMGRSCPGALEKGGERAVGLVDVGRRHPAVHVVAVELAEVGRQVDVAHDRVRLVARPHVIGRAAGAVVDIEFGVEAIVRVRHAQVVADLVRGGRGEAVAGGAQARREETEDVALRSVGPVVVGEAEQAARQIVAHVEVKDGHLIALVAVEVLQQMGIAEEEKVAEAGAAELVAVATRAEGEAQESLLYAGVEAVGARVGGEGVVPLQAGQFGDHLGRLDEIQRVRGRVALEEVHVDVDGARQHRCRDRRLIQRRSGEQQVDGDETRQPRGIARQVVEGPVAVRVAVVPDRRDAVVGFAVAVEVAAADVVVAVPALGAGREVIEPDPARRACRHGGAAPGHHLARGPVDAEVVAGVRVGHIGLGIDVELEVGPPVPVDEEDGVGRGIDAGRRVLRQPVLDRRRVDEVVLADSYSLVALAVVQVLEQRARLGRGIRRQEGEQGVGIGSAGRADVVVEVEAVAGLLAQAVKVGDAVNRLVRGRQGAAKRRGVDGAAAVETDEDDIDLQVLRDRAKAARLQRLELRGGGTYCERQAERRGGDGGDGGEFANPAGQHDGVSFARVRARRNARATCVEARPGIRLPHPRQPAPLLIAAPVPDRCCRG